MPFATSVAIKVDQKLEIQIQMSNRCVPKWENTGSNREADKAKSKATDLGCKVVGTLFNMDWFVWCTCHGQFNGDLSA
jgi:hypothetical protein